MGRTERRGPVPIVECFDDSAVTFNARDVTNRHRIPRTGCHTRLARLFLGGSRAPARNGEAPALGAGASFFRDSVGHRP